LWCHPLTVIDDHSRFAVGLEACTDERMLTVRGEPTEAAARPASKASNSALEQRKSSERSAARTPK
ncbi:UNVERIFIED_ORG: hypothetical protein GGE63_006443, partial [Rhizobium esperanzae]